MAQFVHSGTLFARKYFLYILLEKIYKKVNQTYRNGTPVMEDQRFDVFENFLRSRHPEDKRFWSVGETK